MSLRDRFGRVPQPRARGLGLRRSAEPQRTRRVRLSSLEPYIDTALLNSTAVKLGNGTEESVIWPPLSEQ